MKQTASARALVGSQFAYALAVGFLILYLDEFSGLFHHAPLRQLRMLVEWAVPSARRWTEVSTFPERMGNFVTYVWVLIPIEAMLIGRSRKAREQFQDRIAGHTRHRLMIDLVRVFGVACLLLWLAATFAVVDTLPCTRLCVNSSKLAILWIGVVFGVTCGGLLAVSGWYLLQIRAGAASRP
jgi:hypothetical protein